MCRAHRYPPSTPETLKKSRGIGAHTDFGALTLLMQDERTLSRCFLFKSKQRLTTSTEGGLEVFHKPTETWHPVQPIKDAFVVNIGDMMGEFTDRHDG